MKCLLGQFGTGCLGHAEINDLDDRFAIVQLDENVRRLNVAMNDALVMRMLNGVAHLTKKFQPLGL